MKRIVASLVFAVALIATGAAPAAVPSASASGARTVSISHFEFHPHTLNIAKGTKVVFSNSSGTAHTATDAGAFDTGHIKPGHSVAVRFTQKGTFSYHCEIHPFMHGKIVVG
ncbi:MAG TPA: cupredoxin domain-containing protein [Solirubrobacterales bacterium]|nr:cupredoxin domain-containing protein [Solirubrobacterales bacterium]